MVAPLGRMTEKAQGRGGKTQSAPKPPAVAEEQQGRGLPELPAYAICHILERLDPLCVVRVGSTCRLLHAACLSDRLWSRLVGGAFPTGTLREVHSRCFRGRKVADPFALGDPLLHTLQCFCGHPLLQPSAGAAGAAAESGEWLCVFRSLSRWPFPAEAKVVRYGADETSLLYMFEAPEGVTGGSSGEPEAEPEAEPAATADTAAAPATAAEPSTTCSGGVYHLYARTSVQTNHIHKGSWQPMGLPPAAGDSSEQLQQGHGWRLTPNGHAGTNHTLATFNADYSELTITGAGRGGGGGAEVPFHSNIPPLWRQAVEKPLVLQLGHMKQV